MEQPSNTESNPDTQANATHPAPGSSGRFVFWLGIGLGIYAGVFWVKDYVPVYRSMFVLVWTGVSWLALLRAAVELILIRKGTQGSTQPSQSVL